MTGRELATIEAPSSLAGRYRTLFVLGKGGMGSVEAALQTAPSGVVTGERVVALKRLLPDAARDRRRIDMFLREARLATMLDHPNIVRAWDFGELGGELYLAMEFIEGQPLARLLAAAREAGAPLPLPVVAFVLAEVCEGLHAAHELRDAATGQALNLVHRDVSPQNVIVGYDGRVRILDFGIAKIETESVTKTGEVKGKTAYMSPEQAMGDPLDRRSDLFGVGALLYECLALRRMWGEGTDMEMIRKLALESPPSLETCGRELPAPLVALHGRLVARSAADRPATAHEVATELRAFTTPDAVTELRELVAARFGAESREQRARLSTALGETTGEHAADVLRESGLPPDVAPSTPAPARVSLAAAAPAPRSTGKLVTRLVALTLLAAVFAYGYRTQIATVRLDPPPPPRPTASSTATASASSAPPPPSATPEPSEPPPPTTAPTAATAPRTTPTPRVVRTLPPPPALRPSASPPAPPTAPPKPPDVDEHPF